MLFRNRQQWDTRSRWYNFNIVKKNWTNSFAKKLSVRVLSFPIKCLSGAVNKEIKPFGIESAF